MPRPLSYQSQRHILEYIEANQRIRLVAKCPSLSVVDKTTPIHLEYLYLNTHKINIDRKTYEILESLYVKTRTKEQYRLMRNAIPGATDFKTAVGVLARIFFGNTEKDIYVKCFHHGDFDPKVFEGLKFRAFGLEYLGPQKIHQSLALLADSSFPLKEIHIWSHHLITVNPPVVQQARKLIIEQNRGGSSWINDLKNEILEFEDVSRVDVLIEHFLKNRKTQKKGMCTMTKPYGLLKNVMEDLKAKFKGERVELKEEDKDCQCITEYFAIPMTSETNLIVYGIRLPIGKRANGNRRIVMKIMPI